MKSSESCDGPEDNDHGTDADRAECESKPSVPAEGPLGLKFVGFLLLLSRLRLSFLSFLGRGSVLHVAVIVLLILKAISFDFSLTKMPFTNDYKRYRNEWGG